MRELVGRVLIAVPLLAAVLAASYFDGWWLFGVAAVAGSYFAQTEQWDWEAFALSVPVGLLAAAVLVVNNVRDLETDRRAGKRTLAVKLGRERTRTLYAAMFALAYATVLVPWLAGSLDAWILLSWLTAPLAIGLVLAAWLVMPFPLAVLVGRSMRAGRVATRI